VASGKASHSGGLNSKVSGYAAFAHTFFGEASGMYSAAFNEGTKATAQSQFVVGRYNKINPDALFIVGNGTSDTDRSNAFEVLKDGGINIEGELAIATGAAITSIENFTIAGVNYVLYTIEIPVGFKPMLAKIDMSPSFTDTEWIRENQDIKKTMVLSMTKDSFKFRHMFSGSVSGSGGAGSTEYVIIGQRTYKTYNTVTIIDIDGYVHGPYDITSNEPFIRAVTSFYSDGTHTHALNDIFLNDLRLYRFDEIRMGGYTVDCGLSTTSGGSISIQCTSEGSVFQLEKGRDYVFHMVINPEN
jgi:hypothetical protein